MDLVQGTPSVIETASHAGELTATVIATISGVSGTLAKFVGSFSLKPWVQAVSAVVISAISLGLWAFSYYAYSREGAFNLFAAYGVILLATYGILKGLEHPVLGGKKE